MKRAVAIIFIISVISSCSTQYIPEIKTIDGLLLTLDSSKKVLFSIDTGLIYKRIKICTDDINFIFNNNDSVNREQAFIIDDYSTCRKYYSKYAQKFPRLFQDIETVPRQLENLKKDFSKNLIPKENAEKYLIEEKLAAETIIKNIVQMVDRFESLDKSFNESHEKILHLIQTIKISEEVNPEP